ncbi:MAG: 4-hydroxy-tetrahydrodipicolinate synthase [Candidatus Omnitrophota bacterium]
MLKGSIVALVTPFDNQDQISKDEVERLIDWHIENKTDGILACGTTGECSTLTYPEHKKMVELTVTYVNRRVPVLAGCGSNSTSEALELTAYAESLGADYALVITPYYNKPTQEGLYQHFRKIADSGNIPIIIYNVPSRTGSNISPETVARLYKDCKNIVGIKEASGSLDQITKLMTLVDDKFLLFSGSDETNLPILSVGGVGAISVVANVLPRQTHDLVANFLEGNLSEARRLQLYIYDMVKALFIETNPIPVKTALGEMKKIKPNLRLPLCKMDAANYKTLKDLLKRYKLI